MVSLSTLTTTSEHNSKTWLKTATTMIRIPVNRRKSHGTNLFMLIMVSSIMIKMENHFLILKPLDKPVEELLDLTVLDLSMIKLLGLQLEKKASIK